MFVEIQKQAAVYNTALFLLRARQLHMNEMPQVEITLLQTL